VNVCKQTSLVLGSVMSAQQFAVQYETPLLPQDRLYTCNTVRSVHSYMNASLGRTMLRNGEIKPLIVPYVLLAQLIDTVHTLSTKYT